VGKLKARLAKTPVDQELHSHLARAERELGQALAACQKAIHDSKGFKTSSLKRELEKEYPELNSYQVTQKLDEISKTIGDAAQKKAQSYIRSLTAALEILTSIGFVNSSYVWREEDLVPRKPRPGRREFKPILDRSAYNEDED
jgi:hypothetical protein